MIEKFIISVIFDCMCVSICLDIDEEKVFVEKPVIFFSYSCVRTIRNWVKIEQDVHQIVFGAFGAYLVQF